MQDSPPKILVVDDHVALAQILSEALKTDEAQRVEHVAGAALDLEGVLSVADAFHPDLALVDLYLGGGRSGLAVMGALAGRDITVLAFTASDDSRDIALCLEAGAVGVVQKAVPFVVLLETVEHAAAGRPVFDGPLRETLLAELRASRRQRDQRLRAFDSLTHTEGAVLARLVEGRFPQEIATGQGVTLETVRSHIESIHRKLGVGSQLAAVALAREAGWSEA